MRIKTWKVGQLLKEISRYDGKFWMDIKGHEFCTSYMDCEDSEGYCTVTNCRVVSETEKAYKCDLDGYMTWIPKSLVA